MSVCVCVNSQMHVTHLPLALVIFFPQALGNYDQLSIHSPARAISSMTQLSVRPNLTPHNVPLLH